MVDYLKQMNAIARGVEAKLDSLGAHSQAVTQGTIEVARGLGIPEKAIQTWAAARQQLLTERMTQIQSMEEKLKRSPLAQVFMGMTDVHVCERNPDEWKN